MYGPVRTVVWQGSAGDRRPYADQTVFDEVGIMFRARALLLGPLGHSSDHSEVSECLFDRCNSFRRARILALGRAGCGEPEQLLAMCNPGTLGHKAMLARNPFLDLLIRGALTCGLLLVWMT